jgi:tripartite-type tricarboxylate transporter receptor subunit TctC
VAVTFARVPGIMASAATTRAATSRREPRLPHSAAARRQPPSSAQRGGLVAFAKANPARSVRQLGQRLDGPCRHRALHAHDGTKLLHVMYKGNAQAIVDVMGGQITMMFDQVSTSAATSRRQAARARRHHARALAALPEVPTLDESGLKGYEDVTWNGIVAPPACRAKSFPG